MREGQNMELVKVLDRVTHKVGIKIQDGEEYEDRRGKYRVTYVSIVSAEETADGRPTERPRPTITVTARKLRADGEISGGAGPHTLWKDRPGRETAEGQAWAHVIDSLKEQGYL